jgi:hypothetical protein
MADIEDSVSAYGGFVNRVVATVECPFSLDTMEGKKPSEYIMIRENRPLTGEAKTSVEKKFGAKSAPFSSKVCHMRIYDLESAYRYYVTLGNKDVFTRGVLLHELVEKIKFRYENRALYDIDVSEVDVGKLYERYIKGDEVSEAEYNTMRIHLKATDIPQFQNVTRDEAEAKLTEKDDWLMRPSRMKGYDYMYDEDKKEYVRCSDFYVISLKEEKETEYSPSHKHMLFEHAYGEGYYRVTGHWVDDVLMSSRTEWFPTFFDAIKVFSDKLREKASS